MYLPVICLTKAPLVPEQNTMDGSSWWYGSIRPANPVASQTASVSGKGLISAMWNVVLIVINCWLGMWSCEPQPFAVHTWVFMWFSIKARSFHFFSKVLVKFLPSKQAWLLLCEHLTELVWSVHIQNSLIAHHQLHWFWSQLAPEQPPQRTILLKASQTPTANHCMR